MQKSICTTLLATLISCFTSALLSAQPVDVELKVNNSPMPISPDLYGIFFEDINYAADGGLYAELVQNRSFEYSRGDNKDWNSLSYWKLTSETPSSASIAIESTQPLNENNPHYAVVTINSPSDNNSIINDGFDGIPVIAGERYDFSIFARSIYGTISGLNINIINSNGNSIGSTSVTNITPQWSKLNAVITAKQTYPNAKLKVTIIGKGQIAIDMVSLFPQNTFKQRPNGLRADLAQAIAELEPKFVRFPGGCLAHGDGLDNMYRWKDTIGPVETRKAQRNIWRYHQTLGLGYFEYFQFCEDIGAKPLPVVPAGVCCQNSGHYLNLVPRGQQGIPMNEMDDYIQEILDLIEYANGPETSTWGAKRAAAGHPEPFNLEYLGIGNEDEITETFKTRFKMINDVVTAKHPEIIVIGTTGPFTQGRDYDEGWKFARQENVQMVDEHGYCSPSWFWSNLERFDAYPRTGPTIYLGEYAAHDNNRANTLRSALAEAAYMTTLERNGDIVKLSSYAPLLSRLNRTQWRPDMIYFDNTRISRSTNYYAQQLFSCNSGDKYLPTSVIENKKLTTADTPTSNGIILGTWNTQAEFDDVKVVRNGKAIVSDSFNTSSSNFQTLSGQWQKGSDSFAQYSNQTPALAYLPFPGDQPYTLTLKARKLSGSEGFLIGFNAINAECYTRINLGGWGNRTHALQACQEGSGTTFGPNIPGTIETDRWYNIRINVSSDSVECYLDNQLIVKEALPQIKPTPDIAASTVIDSTTGDIIIKLVCKSDTPLNTNIDLTDFGAISTKTASVTILTGDKMGENKFAQLPIITPTTKPIKVSSSFNFQTPPHSISIIRIPAAYSAKPVLKDYFKNNYYIGTALNYNQINQPNPTESDLIKSQFNAITAENAMKWGSIHPQPNKYNFTTADNFVKFGRDNNMFILGHNLIWHSQTPDWVFKDDNGNPLDRNTLLARMKDHIFTVAGRYKGRVDAWDVVNEAIEPDGTLRKSHWLNIIGDDYIAKAFQFAHQADPEAELYYNDYDMWKKDHRDAAIRLVKDLQAKGVHIDGIGMQGHWGLGYPSLREIEDSILAYSDLGLKVMITELDITVLPGAWHATGADISRNHQYQKELNPYPNSLPADIQQKLANRYVELFALFNIHSDKITRVTFWGLHDGNSWLNNFPVRGRTDYPLLFDRNYQPKPAYNAVLTPKS